MKLHHFLPIPLVCLISITVSGCGASNQTPITPKAPPTTLNANWFVAGARTPATYPLLTTTLAVNGTQIIGQGYFLVHCEGNSIFDSGGTFSLSGQIASDGSFQAKIPEAGGLTGNFQITITGNSPTANSPNTWSGTYTITDSPGYTGCIVNQTAALTAALIPTLNATYTAPIKSSVLGSNATLSMQLTQSGATASPVVGDAVYPVTATINIAGSPCFKSGSTATSKFASEIYGDFLFLNFMMDDGSLLVVSAYLNDLTESTLPTPLFNVMGGACDKASTSTTLTRQ